MGYLKNTLNLLNLHPNFGDRFEGNSSGGMLQIQKLTSAENNWEDKIPCREEVT